MEEIDLRYRKAYLDAGGRQLHYIPALNDGAGHITMLTRLVQRHIQG
ncbi:MAG: ferrochelatase [Gammaproteobacteria bacterium]